MTVGGRRPSKADAQTIRILRVKKGRNRPISDIRQAIVDARMFGLALTSFNPAQPVHQKPLAWP
jgi:hypothetical protein